MLRTSISPEPLIAGQNAGFFSSLYKTFHIALTGREIILLGMARPLRLDSEGGWYHVINRGLEKRQLFPDERTNLHFLDLLSVLPTRVGLRIHAYVLIGNH